MSEFPSMLLLESVAGGCRTNQVIPGIVEAVAIRQLSNAFCFSVSHLSSTC